MARSVRDAGLGLRVLAGPDGLDPYALPVPGPEVPDPQRPLAPLRVGWTPTGGAAPVHPEVEAAVRAAAARLAEQGCRVEPARIPVLEDHDWNRLTLTLYGAESGPYLAPLIAGREGELHPFLRKRLSAPPPSLSEYLAALATWEELRHQVARFFTEHDLLLSPCVPLPAHRHEQSEHTIAGQVVAGRHALRATLPWDLTGSPALAVPFAFSSEQLPIAVQVIGRHFDEATVLRAGMALEAASAVAGRHPPR
jgi:aspartyl-tRNA(Asn)/glutamyl-tRNA(Gln) amidotransferase subunit A